MDRADDGRLQTQDRFASAPGMYSLLPPQGGPPIFHQEILGLDGNFQYQNYTQKPKFTQSVGNALFEGKSE